jgi:ketosteroid isomerase-like protein
LKCLGVKGWLAAQHQVQEAASAAQDGEMEHVDDDGALRWATVNDIYADAVTVIALFDAAAIASDGQPYHNSYPWFMYRRDRQITDVTALFDSIAFNDP